MQESDRLHAWCALWRTPKIGAKRFAKILEVFGSPEAFFSLSAHERNSIGVTFDADTLASAQRNAEADIEWLSSHHDAAILTRNDAAYPQQLLTIADPPPLLFVRGDAALLSQPQLAMVGSRSPSHEGIENAKNFASFLAKQGIVITSGLALGIDGAAHSGALLSGETIAVMGTGADRIYPAKHRELAYQMVESGCIITELPVGTPVVSHAFPRRNRIISGLSLGTLVVEASLNSGSLITARTALEQNREVFAIPGSIHNPLARGCNHLIRNGAKLVETAKDIFEELRPQLLAFVESEKSDTLEKDSLASDKVEESLNNPTMVNELLTQFDDAEKQQLWEALSYEPQSVDVLVKRSGLPANQVSSTLLILELSGHVVKHHGGRYHKLGK